GNDAKRVDLLNVTGDSELETFDVYLPLFFPRTGPKLSLVVQPLAGKPFPSVVTALTFDERVAPIRARVQGRRGGDLPLWEFRFLSPRVAYLGMPDWALYDSKWDWHGFLEDVFAQLDGKKPSHLVVDLRGNEGGLDAGDPILGHLVERSLHARPYERRVRYRSVAPELIPYLDTWDPSFKDWGDQAVDLHDGFFRLARQGDAADGDLIRPLAPRFAGKVWVLIDAANSSATFQF